jgi:integrase
LPTIKARKQANGIKRYTAIVRLREGKSLIHQESRTFSQKTTALNWARRREVALESPEELARAREQKPEAATLGQLIRWYIDTFQQLSRWQRTKQAHLKFLERTALGQCDALTLTTGRLIQHVQERRAAGAGPATAANDLVWIGVVLRAARSVRDLPVDPRIVQDARVACSELRLTAKSRKRSRRPTAEELERLRKHFAHRDRRADIPMLAIMEFALTSARREAEICRLEWQGNDAKTRTGMVRDAKHPRAKDGNHRRFKYTPEAWAVVEAQPRSSTRIFPYDPKSVSAAFTRTCKVLGIADLRFHDLRHEATSRLFERGYQIHEVAQFTLHDSWNELKRYANLRPENVRELPVKAPKPSVEPPEQVDLFTLPVVDARQSVPPGRRH